MPEKAEEVRELAMCIRREVWEDLEKKHGGGPFVPRLEACTVCQVSVLSYSTVGVDNLYASYMYVQYLPSYV